MRTERDNPGELAGLDCLVVGGSLGGLAAALCLLERGARVRVFERSTGVLQDRGAGLGVDPALVARFLGGGPALICERPARRRVIAGGTEWRERTSIAVTSYDLLYRALRSRLPEDCYRPGRTLVSIGQEAGAGEVVAGFSDGGRETGELLVCADGFQSGSRRLLPASFLGDDDGGRA